MRVTVRLFARLREIAGAETIDLDVPDGSSVAGAWNVLSAECPALSGFQSTISAAVNAEYTRMNRELREGDEVAFLPPVSGGQPTVF